MALVMEIYANVLRCLNSERKPVPFINEITRRRRAFWLEEIVKISGNFGSDAERVEAELAAELERDGPDACIDHLRVCGNIPEQYGHDTSEEKLYSKYTDVVLAAALRLCGLRATVLTERADAADVVAVHSDWALVGDAKAFRLSRTAKNQKDFKVEAMHGWKRGREHALLICPSYQLPTRSSQIYQQSLARNVSILSYAHLAVLVRLAGASNHGAAIGALTNVMKCAEAQMPTKDAVFYWTLVNGTFLAGDQKIADLWKEEKQATIEVIAYAKEEALQALARERDSIMRMSHDEAVHALIRNRNIDGRTSVVESIQDNGLLRIG